jgi:hypothetical protein
MSVTRRGIKLTAKGNAVEVLFPSGEKRIVINANLTGDVAEQDEIILHAGKPADYSAPSFGGGICR